MNTKRCPISGKDMLEHEMVKVNEYHYFDPFTLKQMISHAYLGIPIDVASQYEWVITAISDTVDNTNIIRFRNPYTNNAFTEDELKRIYISLSLSDENNTRKTRSTR